MKPRHFHSPLQTSIFMQLSKSTLRPVAFAAVIVSFLGNSVQAGNRYFDTATTANLQGGTGTFDLGTTSVWSTVTGGSNPLVTFTSGDDGFFQTGAVNTVTLSGTVIANSLTQTTNTTATTISGGTLLTINSGGLSNTGNQAFTINSAISLGASQNWFANTNTLVVGGTVTVDNAVATSTTTTLGFTGANTTGSTLSGIVSNNAADATKILAINQSGTGLTTLSGLNTYSGGTTVSAGTLVASNAAATNQFLALGTGTVTLNGGILGLRANGSAANQSIITGNGTTGNDVVVGGNATINTNNAGTNFTGNVFVFNNLSIGANTLIVTPVANGYGVRFAGTTTLTGSATFNIQGGLTTTLVGAVGDGGSGFGISKTGTSTLALTGANTYTGATTIGTAGSAGNGGIITISGTVGTIATSSAYTINGNSSKLLLDNTAGNVDRLKDTNAVTLNYGGELSLTGNATTNTTETIASLALGSGSGIVTVSSAAGRVSTLAATGALTRTNNSTGLVRGTSLDQSAATNVSRITLGTAPTGADFVGTNTLTGGTASDATQALKIIPWLLGDTAVAGTGKNFVTYDSTLGLRVLNATEMTTLVAGSTTAANPVNAISFNGTVTTSGLTVNSLLFNTASQTLNGSGALTVNSGAVAAVTNTEAIGSGFSSLVLGNDEGVVTATSGNTLTINTPVDVTSSGGLTTSGAGTVVLAASNLYTGVTTVNQGTLRIGAAGSTGDLGSNTANIVLNGGNLAINRTGTLTLANDISGIGTVSQVTTVGTLVLSGSNTYSGATTAIAGGTLQALALPGNTTSGVSAALSANSALTLAAGTTLQLRGDSSVTFNSGIITLPNAAVGTNITFDVDTNGAATTGNVYTLGGTLPAVNVNQGGAATQSLTLNVTGGHNSILSLGNMQLTTSGNNGAFIINPTTGNLIMAGLIGSTANATVTTFTGSGSSTFTAAVQQGAGRGLTLNLNQTGSVIINATSTNGTTWNLNQGTLVLNTGTAINNAATFGTTTATANNVNVLLGGTNATGTVAGTNGGITNANTWKTNDNDTGTLTLGGQNTSGTNTYSGVVTLGTTLNTGKDLNLVASAGGQVDFTNTIVKNGTATTGGLTINSAYTMNGSTVTPTGTVRLTGNNTYVGGTTVNAGTLLVNNTAGSGTGTGTVGVSSGATLGGSGTISGAVTLTTATLAPGSAAATVGTETFGAGLALNSTSIFEWDMQQAATTDPGAAPAAGGTNPGSYDKVVLNGAANSLTGSGAVFKVVLGSGKAFNDAFWDTDKTWNNVFSGTGIATSLSSIFSTFNADGSDLAAGVVTGQGTFTFSGGNTVNWTAVPEPTTALVGLLITAGLLRRRRTA
ncbi:MAG: autotransporter-associated beta strand repeat-containing protein [Luteolibacter sp.]